MKIGVSSYSFHSYMDKTGADVFKIIDKAKEIGFDAIEFISVYAPEGKDQIEQAKEIKAYCDDKGLPISAYTIWADLLNDQEASVDRLINTELKITQALGAPLMRHDVTGGFNKGIKHGRGFDDCLPVVVPAIRKVTEAAQEMGIRTMSENHGFFCQDSDRVEKLLNTVNHDNYGLLLDMGNFLCADDDPAVAVGKLAPYAFHVHAKDFFIRDGERSDPGDGWFRTRGGKYIRGTIVGQGVVPLDICVKTIMDSGYDGIFSIEFEGCEDNIFALEAGLKNLRKRF